MTKTESLSYMWATNYRIRKYSGNLPCTGMAKSIYDRTLWALESHMKDCVSQLPNHFHRPYDCLDEGSGRRKAHRTTQTQNKRTQTSTPWVRFETTNPVFEREKIFHSSDRAATVMGYLIKSHENNNGYRWDGKVILGRIVKGSSLEFY
jgi:hypothetical protein